MIKKCVSKSDANYWLFIWEIPPFISFSRFILIKQQRNWQCVPTPRPYETRMTPKMSTRGNTTKKQKFRHGAKARLRNKFWHIRMFTDPSRHLKQWSEMWLTPLQIQAPGTSTCHRVSYSGKNYVNHIYPGYAILLPDV